MNRSILVALAVVTLVASVGCTGGGGAAAPTGNPTTQTYGTVSSQVVLNQDPLWIRGAASTAYALVGTVTDATYNNTDPGMADTQMLVAAGKALVSYDADGTYTTTYRPSAPVPARSMSKTEPTSRQTGPA